MSKSGVKKWLWANAVYDDYNGLLYYPIPGNNFPRELDLQWLKDNDYGVNVYIPYIILQPDASPPVSQTFEQQTDGLFEALSDYDIKVEFFLNDIFYSVASGVGYDPNLPNNTVARAMPSSYYADKYGDLFTAIEDKWGPDGTGILTTYWAESAWNGAADWLYGRQERGGGSAPDLELRNGVYHGGFWGAGTVNSFFTNEAEPFEDAISRRMAIIDGLDIELWCLDDLTVYRLDDAGVYMQEHYSEISLGLNSIAHCGPSIDLYIDGVHIAPPTAQGVQWPIHQEGDETRASWDLQTRRFLQAVYMMTLKIDKFDVIQPQTSNSLETYAIFDNDKWPPRVKTDPTWWEFQQQDLELWESLNLLTTRNTVELTNMAYETTLGG